MTTVTVVRPFYGYAVGDFITDDVAVLLTHAAATVVSTLNINALIDGPNGRHIYVNDRNPANPGTTSVNPATFPTASIADAIAGTSNTELMTPLSTAAALGVETARAEAAEARAATPSLSDVIATGGAQAIAIPLPFSVAGVFLNGLRQGSNAFLITATGITTPTDTVAGDLVSIEYFA